MTSVVLADDHPVTLADPQRRLVRALVGIALEKPLEVPIVRLGRRRARHAVAVRADGSARRRRGVPTARGS